MGGTTFQNVVVETSPEAAFHAAVSRAQYDYGHAGYTGTIAEKSSFELIVPEAAEIERIRTERLQWAQADVAKIAEAKVGDRRDKWSMWTDQKMIDTAFKLAVQRVERLKAPGIPLEVGREIAEGLIEEGDERIDDKWGPAGCIATNGGYLFFGWASE